MLKKTNSVVTVNLTTIKKNLDKLSSFLNESTKVMAVVKANAYGHGALKVARFLERSVSAFAVNDIQEGIELREGGISKPILVFGVPEESFAAQYKIHELTATVSSKAHFKVLPERVNYHLNFNTGMKRLGFEPGETEEVAQLVEQHEQLSCTGIYTHFATADDPESALVEKQHKKFQEIITHFPESLTTHICNTAGTSFHKRKQFDMVRLGIGMYGYSPGETEVEGLQPALKWSTRIVQLNRVKAGETVSYGAKWRAPSNGYLGVIPVGYSDGLQRNLSGKFSVRIGSKDYEVAGTITMNFCMVFLQNDFYETGTEVQLIHSENNASEWAKKIGTIPYEILTGINGKVPRRYKS